MLTCSDVCRSVVAQSAEDLVETGKALHLEEQVYSIYFLY
jgi:hypothetical protein